MEIFCCSNEKQGSANLVRITLSIFFWETNFSEEKDNGSAVTSPIDDTQVEPVLTEAEKPEQPAESKVEEETEEVKDAWDISSAEEEEEDEEEAESKAVEQSVKKGKIHKDLIVLLTFGRVQ